jgi:hypothetical protein
VLGDILGYVGAVVSELTDPGRYQERYAWTRRTGSVAIAGALAVAVSVGVTLPQLPTIVLLGAGILAVIWVALHRRVAFRADATGITFGAAPLRYRATSAHVPWSDIASVVLWQQVQRSGSLVSHVGIERRPGAPALAALARSSPVAGTQGGLVPDIPGDVLTASRPVSGWRLDRRGLARAVTSFAPDVAVIDFDTGQLIPGD